MYDTKISDSLLLLLLLFMFLFWFLNLKYELYVSFPKDFPKDV